MDNITSQELDSISDGATATSVTDVDSEHILCFYVISEGPFSGPFQGPNLPLQAKQRIISSLWSIKSYYTREIHCISLTTINTTNLTTVMAAGQRLAPPHCVPLGAYQCQMFNKTGVHHLFTHLNKALRSTRCCNNNNMALPSWTCAAFYWCTLDPFGTRATNIGCQQQIKFPWGGVKHPWRHLLGTWGTQTQAWGLCVTWLAKTNQTKQIL